MYYITKNSRIQYNTLSDYFDENQDVLNKVLSIIKGYDISQE